MFTCDVCYMCLVDMLHGTAFAPVKADINGNIRVSQLDELLSLLFSCCYYCFEINE